jgi:hypothetical protein
LEEEAMDEGDVRAHAQAHAEAVVAGDLSSAGRDLGEEARPKAPAIMRRLPTPLERVLVTSVESGDDDCAVLIRYEGGGREATVRTLWADRGGRPRIVDMEIV